jgi:hypothetical protein
VALAGEVTIKEIVIHVCFLLFPFPGFGFLPVTPFVPPWPGRHLCLRQVQAGQANTGGISEAILWTPVRDGNECSALECSSVYCSAISISRTNSACD